MIVVAEGHGGYRTPSKPAAVSGPGALSKRTDGKPGQALQTLPDAQYGEAADYQQIQQGAPLAKASTLSPDAPVADPLASVVPLHAPSQQPGTPVTDGAAAGPGQGPGALGLPVDPNHADAQYLQKYLPVMIRIADSDSTPPGFKSWVRNIIANV